MVTTLTPYFQSETTAKEFEQEFKSKMPTQLLKMINKRLSEGINLPLGWDHQNKKKTSNKISIYKDYILISQKVNQTDTETKNSEDRFEMTHFQNYDHEQDEATLRNYPISYVVNRSKVARKYINGEPATSNTTINQGKKAKTKSSDSGQGGATDGDMNDEL